MHVNMNTAKPGDRQLRRRARHSSRPLPHTAVPRCWWMNGALPRYSVTCLRSAISVSGSTKLLFKRFSFDATLHEVKVEDVEDKTNCVDDCQCVGRADSKVKFDIPP